ncbi:hypothetical protein KBC79_06445, partial [Candidatus Woesebacteria bacterium]|nr:hypothetical protein [Candidatus Woesebacteria bacterium]
RLVIPRSVSPLRAASIAYALKLPEVVYVDQLQLLQDEIDAGLLQAFNEIKEIVTHFELITSQEEESQSDVAAFISEIRTKASLGEQDKDIALLYFSQSDTDRTQGFLDERRNLLEALEGEVVQLDTLVEHTPKKEWFTRDSTIHGTPHILRVFVNAELLIGLAKKEGISLDMDAIRKAVMLHDTRRKSDSASDIKHGERAAAFSDTLPELDKTNRELAKQIMTTHSLDDYDQMLPEEVVMKDADALERYRFRSGPDWRFIRNEFSQQIAHCAYHLASLSKVYLEYGYTRAEAVYKAGLALGIVTAGN